MKRRIEPEHIMKDNKEPGNNMPITNNKLLIRFLMSGITWK